MERSSRSDSGTDTPTNWLNDFAGSLVDSAVCKPLDGAIQLINMTGLAVPELPMLNKSDSSSQESVAGKAGSVLGMVVPYLLISKALGGALGDQAVVDASEAMAPARSIGIKSAVARAGLSGLIYGGIFSPAQSTSAGGFLKDRLSNAFLDGSTFAAFTGLAGAADGLPVLQKMGRAGFAGTLRSVGANALAGIPTGLWAQEAGSVLNTGHLASWSDEGQAAVDYMAFGGVFAGLAHGVDALRGYNAGSESGSDSATSQVGGRSTPESLVGHANGDSSVRSSAVGEGTEPRSLIELDNGDSYSRSSDFGEHREPESLEDKYPALSVSDEDDHSLPLNNGRNLQLTEDGLVERDSQGRVLKATGRSGTFQYEWSGDTLVRATVPENGVYDRVDDTHWLISNPTNPEQAPETYRMTLALDPDDLSVTRNLLDRGEIHQYRLNGDVMAKLPIQEHSQVQATVYHYEGSRSNLFRDGTSEHLTREQAVSGDGANKVLNQGLLDAVQKNDTFAGLSQLLSSDRALSEKGTVYLFDGDGKVIEDAYDQPMALPASAIQDGSGLWDENLQALFNDRDRIAGAAVVSDVLDGAGNPIEVDRGPDLYAREVKSVVGDVAEDLVPGMSHQDLLRTFPGDLMQKMITHADSTRSMDAIFKPRPEGSASPEVAPLVEHLDNGGTIERDPLTKAIVRTTDTYGYQSAYEWQGGRLARVTTDGGAVYARTDNNLWEVSSPDGLTENLKGDLALDVRDGALIETRNYNSAQKLVQTRYGLDGNVSQVEFTKDGVTFNCPEP